MKYAHAITGVSRQLIKVCEQIESLALVIQETEQINANLSSAYELMLLDEVEHAQVLTLELTKLFTSEDDNVNTDEGGSVFAAGELTDEKNPAEENITDGDEKVVAQE